MRVHLLEFHLVRSDWLPRAIEDKEPCARCSLIDRANEPFLELLLVLPKDMSLLAMSRNLPRVRRMCGLGHYEGITIRNRSLLDCGEPEIRRGF